MEYKRVVDQLYESNLKIVHLLEHISLVLKRTAINMLQIRNLYPSGSLRQPCSREFLQIG